MPLGMPQNVTSALVDRTSTPQSQADMAALQCAADALPTSQQSFATVLNSDQCLLNDTMSGFRQAWTGPIAVSERGTIHANLLVKRKRAGLDVSAQLFRPNEDRMLAEIPEDTALQYGTDFRDNLGLAASTKALRAIPDATIQRQAVRKRLALAKHDRDKLQHTAKKLRPGVKENIVEINVSR